MLFTLIKNELIKITKRSKTWIVFVLFTAFIGLTIFSVYQSDKYMREARMPETMLQNCQNELNYINEEIKTVTDDKDYMEYLNEQKADLEESIAYYQDVIKNGISDEDEWKKELEDNIDSIKSDIEIYENQDDQWSTEYLQSLNEQLELYTYLQDNNIKLIENWEYEAANYMKQLMGFLAMSILVAGIAVFMSDIVSGECTPATLKFLLIQPITRGKVLLSKFIAVTITVLTMILGAEGLGLLLVRVTSGISSDNYPIILGKLYETVTARDGSKSIVEIAGSGYLGTNSEFLIKAFLLQALFIITACAVIFLISTLFKSSMVTMATSVVVSIFITIGSYMLSPLQKIAHLVFLNYSNPCNLLTGDIVMEFYNANMTLQTGIIVMIVTTIVAYVIAHINFNRKDILI